MWEWKVYNEGWTVQLERLGYGLMQLESGISKSYLVSYSNMAILDSPLNYGPWAGWIRV